ncbi:MAG: APC family permease [Kineosporiaceae bacterium]
MTTQDPSTTAVPGDHRVNTGLRAGAIGLVSVLFMAVANAAPITAMSFNVPIAIGYGNGLGAPAGFLFATVVLTFFTIGFVSMSKHITTTGAFYGFISHGLGQVAGMASGLLATVAYVIFEGSLVGGFAYFAHDAVMTSFDVNIHWLVFGLVGAVLIGVLTYYSVTLTAAVLGVTLVSEVLLLGALGISVLVKGGPDGYLFAETVPITPAFSPLDEAAFGTAAAAGVAAIGIFFAFWSWVGYETTAVYGEESKDPAHIVPRATLIAVVGLGLFYTFMSWMVIVGQGRAKAVELSAGSAPVELWLSLVRANLGGFAEGAYKVLLVLGSFACAMAFHNAASRYIYALGRETPWAGVRNTVGATNPKHQSPAVASWIQMLITIVLTLLFFAFTSVRAPDANGTLVDSPDLVPYVNLYGILALIGTAMILIVQTICSAAVISYFFVRKVHPGNVLWSLVCPVVGGAGMIYALTLLWQNREFAAGLGAGSKVFTFMPYYVVLTLLVGLGYALWLRSSHPETYGEVGRTTLAEAHERS